MSNWAEIESQYNKGDYKNYALEGEHKTKVSKVELVESSRKKTPGLTFFFADNEEYAFPKFGATHWFSTDEKKINWRKYHSRELLRELGLTKEQAEKSVDICEEKEEIGKIMQAYLAIFKKAISKSGEVDVVVFKRKADDKYPTIDFANGNVRMNRPEEEKEEEEEEKEESILDGAEEMDLSELPF